MTTKGKRPDWSQYFYLSPDSLSGLRWRISIESGHGKIQARCGQVAGARSTSKGKTYWVVQLDGKKYTVHRILWELHNGLIPDGYVINHINGEGSDNTITNLELRTQQENILLQKRNTNLSNIGVSKVCSHGTWWYWRAVWRGIDGKRKSQDFSIEKYGDTLAQKLAIDAKRNGLTSLLKKLEVM